MLKYLYHYIYYSLPIVPTSSKTRSFRYHDHFLLSDDLYNQSATIVTCCYLNFEPIVLLDNPSISLCYRLLRLVVKRGFLHAENLFCATLGAAYAAMTRDSLKLENVKNITVKSLIVT